MSPNQWCASSCATTSSYVKTGHASSKVGDMSGGAPASRSSDSVKPVALVVSIAPENSRSTTWSYLTQGYG